MIVPVPEWMAERMQVLDFRKIYDENNIGELLHDLGLENDDIPDCDGDTCRL